MKYLFLLFSLSLLGHFSFSQCDLEVTITVTQPTCYGFSDGSIIVEIGGGTAPYELNVLDSEGIFVDCIGGGTGFILSDGWYFIYIEDSLGCVFEDSVEVIEPAELMIDLTITNPTYPGACNGELIADTVYNYQEDYENIYYAWCDLPSGIGMNSLTDVCAGVYCLTISDGYGCTKTIDFSIGSLANLEPNDTKSFSVNINPQTNEISILNPNNIASDFTLVNLAGQKLYSTTLIGGINNITPQLNTGIYIYTITTSIGIIQTKKIKIN